MIALFLCAMVNSKIFHFQQFDVRYERSAMKVNTDAVLLGALLSLPTSGLLPSVASVSGVVSDVASTPNYRVLDVGTGTGVIALMLAQRLCQRTFCDDASSARSGDSTEVETGALEIVGIDIDEPSAQEAADNFSASPWSSCLSVRAVALQDLRGDEKWDLICSNPPCFEQSLKNPDARLSQARHTHELSYEDIFDYASKHLTNDGLLAFVLPCDVREKMVRVAASYGFYLSREVLVKSTERKSPKRFVSEWTRVKFSENRSEELILMKNGAWTEEYLALVSKFLYLTAKKP